MSTRTDTVESLAVVHPNAAGLDIGAREIWACVPADRVSESVQYFATFTPDLHSLADWLVKHAIDTVAMESTGVYWIPVFEILEARGLKVYLVNAHYLKKVPGRKTDVLDCQWIQKLHSFGLLTGSFRPDGEMVALRAYLRHRAQLLEHRAPHILHMQKALQQMNLQLHHVLSDVTGVTGQAILRAIVAGEREPVKLAQLRNPGCKSSEETIAKALTGSWKAEHLFTLRQSLELYDFYTQQVMTCDAEIEKQYSAMKPRWEGPEEEAIILPAVQALQAEGIGAFGPLPADTLFHAEARSTYDAVLCMYHDQALIPVKMLGFWEGVNVTLGLPFVRTSPDHGTALSLAGSGKADPGSLMAALRRADRMANARAGAA